ncbi:MAG: DNA internalization-related competence protein ComEC/Rec2 [Eubacterium sp.]|nr:DNA internalization-related competence protein ComEC/Rec2 [Eubacterium sp.]
MKKIMFRRPLFAVFLLQILFIGIWYHIFSGEETPPQEDIPVECVGRVGEIRIGTSGKVLVLSDVKVKNKDAGGEILTDQCIVYDFSDKLLFSNSKIGNTIRIKGTYSTFQTVSNPGGFDEDLYYKSQGISAKIFADSLEMVNNRLDPIRHGLFLLRQRAMEQLLEVMEERDAGVLGAMILGEKSYLPADRKEQFQKTGIGHLLAISGLHVSLLGAGLFFFLRSYCLPMRQAVVATVVFLFLYGQFTGFPVATERAVLMMACGLFARYTGRCYDALSAMALSGIITLLQQPLQLFQCGFILSYAAIAGIVLFSPVMEKLDPYFKKNGLWGRILQAVLSSVSVFMITMPVMLWFFYEISLYSILANLVVLPLLSLLVGAGVFGCILSFFWKAAGGFLLSTVHYILRFYEMVCLVVEELPGRSIMTGRPAPELILLYYVVLVGGLFLYLKREKKWIAAVAGMFLAGTFFLFPPDVPFLYMQLDVGQGDCSVILCGEKTYLIDGGSTSQKEVGKYVISKCLKYYGRSGVDAVFITHSDADHTNGILELAENQKNWGIKIGKIIMPEIQKTDEGYKRLYRSFRSYNISVNRMKKGDVLSCQALRIRCVHPTPEYEWESENDYSLTLDITYRDLRILATGDLEQEGETAVGDLRGGYDLLKVGHHGSKTSTSQEFLAMVSPRYAVISAGKKNRYGHPSPETVKKLRNAGVQIRNTMECGAVFVEWRSGKRIYIFQEK